MTSTIDLATFYAGHGWFVFPVKPHDKIPLVKWADECTTDLTQIRTWWEKYPDANIGIVTGKKSGIVVLDVDEKTGGFETLLTLTAEHGKMPDTPESMTGGGGRHLVFAHPGKEIPNSAGKLGTGLDIRGDGGYIVAPPSIHPNGKIYQWEISSLPSKVPLAPMPEWMVNSLLATDGNGKKPLAPQVPEEIKQGMRDQVLASLAGTMRRRGMDSDAIYAALQVENDKRCKPPLEDKDLQRIAKSIGRYDPATPPTAIAQELNEEIKFELHEPVNTYEVNTAFLDLLNHLEGRNLLTYIPAIDVCLGGLERQTLSVLAGRPSMGKSTLAWQIGRNSAAAGKHVMMFSLEMSATSLWAKAACGSLGIRWREVRMGRVGPENMERLINEAVRLTGIYEDRLWIDDQVNSTTTIFKIVEKYKPDLVIIDHLRLVSDRIENEVQRLGYISKRMKDLAKAFNCHVMMLAQLNRGTEGRDDKRPQMSDLRDSGQIEETGDSILMMYRDDYYSNEATGDVSETEILVRKFRDDIPNQKIRIPFNKRFQWFGDRNDV